MSVADGLSTGNPWVAIGTALYRGLTSNSVGFGPGGPLRAFLERVVAVSQQPPTPTSSATSSGTLRTIPDSGSPTIGAPQTSSSSAYALPPFIFGAQPQPKVPTPGPRRRFPRRRRAPARRAPRRAPPRRVPRVPVPRVPSPDVPGTRIPRVLPRILRPIGLPFLIFWPSRIGKEAPVRIEEIPRPRPRPAPTGPQRRPVVRPPMVPSPGTDRDTVSRPVPDQPQPRPQPRAQPRIEPPPVVGPVFDPTQLPRPVAVPTPTPSAPPWIKPLTYALPFALPFLSPSPRPAAPLPLTAPATGPTPSAPGIPLTTFQPGRLELPQPETDPCRRANPQRKRRKRKCTNRITSRRTFRKNGARYRTITRKLEC